MTPKQRAEKLARQLFHNAKDERAYRLVLTSYDGRDLGGWGFLPIVDQIECAIRDAESAMKERCAETAIDIGNQGGRSAQNTAEEIAAAIRSLP